MEQQIISKIWQLSGLIGRVTPGLLTWENGNVAYLTEEGVVFDVPLAELKNIKWPFLRMGLGFDAVVSGKKYQFSFSKPNASAPELGDSDILQLMRMTPGGRFADSIKTLGNLKADKATTRQWKEILKGA